MKTLVIVVLILTALIVWLIVGQATLLDEQEQCMDELRAVSARLLRTEEALKSADKKLSEALKASANEQKK